MAIHMGVMCEACRRVHFVGTSDRIKPSRTARMYRLACILPCLETREFRVDAMRPYRVAEEVFEGGCAKEGDYELVRGAKSPRPTGKRGLEGR